MEGAPWELQEPSGAPITPNGGAVRESFPEELVLSEGAHLSLHPLSVVQRLGLSPQPASLKVIQTPAHLRNPSTRA